MMDTWVVLGLILGTAIFFINLYAKSQRKEAIKEDLFKIDNFEVEEYFIGKDGGTGIAINKKDLKICIINIVSNIKKIVDYKNIVSVELIEDDATVTKTVRTSQLGSAIVGGAVFGGIGAVVGGLTGNTKNINKVKSIILKILVNDLEIPVHSIKFMDIECNKNSTYHKSSKEIAEYWIGLIQIFIKRADLENNIPVKNIPIKDNIVNINNIGDELQKLADLKKTGYLTEDEFNKLKQKILNS